MDWEKNVGQTVLEVGGFLSLMILSFLKYLLAIGVINRIRMSD